MILAPDLPNKLICPIWDGLKQTSFQQPSPEQNVLEDGIPFYSSRAGGPFRLMPSGAALLDFESGGDERKSLTDRQKANLSYSIYKHNLENHLFDQLSNEVLQEPSLFLNWMDDHRDRVLDQESQGFVAMWFADCMDKVYKEGIEPAIRAAGYNPRRIDNKEFTGPVVDEILAEIRKSKFVVADFTGCEKCTACEKCKHIGAPGGVYWEAGFAHGLDIPVFLTCHKDRGDAIHFNIDHIKRLHWDTPEDLCKQLKNSIEAVLGPGPLDP